MQWLKEIPSHWETKRIASLFTGKVQANTDFKYHHAFKFYYGTLVPKNEVGDIEEYRDTYVKYSVLQKDDIMINGLNLNYDFVSQRVAIAPSDGIITSAYVVARPRKNTNAQYYNYLFKTMDNMKLFHGMGTGIRLTLSFDEMKKQVVIVPPQDEQQAIVAYIEEKCQKIDAYVADKEKEIELLQELKQKSIADAVTKGLNPDAKMKDSGISWIGEIPEHWEIRHLSQVSYEHYLSNKEVHHQNLLSLSYGRIIRKDINTTEGLLPASFDTYQIVEEGNIVMRLTDLQNDHKSLRVGLVKEEGIVTSAYVCLGVFDSMVPSYLYNVLHSYDIKKLFYSMGGGLRQNLNWQGLKKLDIPLPPLDEQQAIVAYIEEKCEKIDKLASELQSEIDYLKEYKQRLIADCVTGQVKVQNNSDNATYLKTF